LREVGRSKLIFFQIDSWSKAERDSLPFLFAIFIDGSLVNKIKDANTGCYVSTICVSVLYADDILLISPSVTGLQTLVNICETELNNIDMSINAKNLCVSDLVHDLTLLVNILHH
jgi:hypothetical protein